MSDVGDYRERTAELVPASTVPTPRHLIMRDNGLRLLGLRV
jgi:hypothetical protein